jgi:hypothetical protein
MTKQPGKYRFLLLDGRFAVVRLPPESSIPAWATSGRFFSITRTDDELSVVCRQESVPGNMTVSNDWSCLKLIGPFAFDETGVVALVTRTIADADVGVFVVSTYDGDHILVKEADISIVTSALRSAGHLVGN